ncbi:MAG: hypothetical protein AAF696_27275, partial [Bacteroidota bacterium]
MNPKEKQSRIFSYLRDSRLEMSEEEVHQLIQKLPHLPVPKGGHPLSIHIGINLNSIIMNSIFIIALISGLLYFGQKEEKITEPQESYVPTQLQVELQEPKPLASNDLEGNEDIHFPEERIERAREENREAVKEPNSLTPSSLQKVAEKDLSASKIGSTSKASGKELEIDLATDKQAKNIEAGVRRSFKGKFFFHFNSPLTLSQAKVQAFKKELQEELKKDGFLNRKKPITIFYSNEGISINDGQLASSELVVYEKLCEKYGVKKAENRQVQLRDEIILIGDFDEAGEMRRGILEGKGEIVLNNLEPYEDEGGKALFEEKGDGLFGQEITPCKQALKFKGDISLFSKKLKARLSTDNLFESKDGETRLWFPK